MTDKAWDSDCLSCQWYDSYLFRCRAIGKCVKAENTAVGYAPPIKKTNADRIRSMSDAELAGFFCDIGNCDRRCPAKIGDCIFSDAMCAGAWLDWLKQEAVPDA